MVNQQVSPPMLKELFVLRSIACLSIVFLHSITIGLQSLSLKEIGESMYIVFDSIQVFLYFGTPMFIFMSEFLLAYSYRNKVLPNDFLRKRLKFIFFPFIFMAFFYSIPYATSFHEWGLKFFLNAVIGDFHGYFVLIIFQFYLIHKWFHHRLRLANPFKVIAGALVINIAYLSIFHFTEAPSIPFAEYIWTRFYWVPFLGWIFYFVLGYYCGLYYEKIVMYVKKNTRIIFMAPILSTILLLTLYHFELLSVHSSKRIDMLFHTVAIGAFIIYISLQFKHLSHAFVFFSQYSFGIYLLHFFYILLVDTIYNMTTVSIGISYIFFLFLFSTICSIITVHYLNKWEYGKYLVGKIGIGYSTTHKNTLSKSGVLSGKTSTQQ